MPSIASTSDTYLTGILILSNMELVQDPNNDPDNLFPYLEGTLSAFTKTGRLAYAHFDSDTLMRRRDPSTNLTLYNIDIPRYGLAPSISYRMAGSRTHLDASLLRPVISYPYPGTANTLWSGQFWVPINALYPRCNYVQMDFNYLFDSDTSKKNNSMYVADPRFAEFFW